MADPHGPGKISVKAPIVGGLPESTTRQSEEEGTRDAEGGAGTSSSGHAAGASTASKPDKEDHVVEEDLKQSAADEKPAEGDLLI